ncbi:MAG: amidohydrolase family protein [Bacteroidales bacterium]|nr:amidohydrolase family protein [Bacteroidales bacterium]
MSYTIINSHIHTFRDVDIPRKFLPLGIVRLLASNFGSNVFTHLLSNINPFSDKDLFDRYVKFIKTGKLPSQQKIFEDCQKFYPSGTRFVILPMDMAYMGAGRVPRDYSQQLDELAELKKTYPKEIIPFVHIDPRRPNYFDLFKKYVEEHDFQGLKLYPPLGVFPYDERFNPVYEYCEKHHLPVIAHCSPYNPVHFKGSKRDLKELLSKSKTPIDFNEKRRKYLCSNFTHPANYKYVMKDFPDLKISVAHFGSGDFWKEFLEEPGNKDNWFSIIKDMIIKHPNFYTDVSFTMSEKSYFSLLKVIMMEKNVREKILFGSDYYMVETKSNERRFGLDLRAFLGDSYFKDIAHTNPKAFIGL